LSEVKEVKSDIKKQSVAEMEAEIRQLELESKRLEVAEKKANLQDLQERLDERELKRENKRQRSVTNGATLSQLSANDRAAQVRCNHRKGGQGQNGIVAGQGDDSQYAVIKHTFLNGDVWVRCLRCGRTWKPPLEENFYFDEKGQQVHPTSDSFGHIVTPKTGKLSYEKYQAALADYFAAVNFTTRNSPSSSYVFKFSDGGKYFREIMNNANLR
jgi:hypothetical protein